MEVMHAIAGLAPAAGGTTRAVCNLIDAIAIDQELGFSLVSQRLISTPIVCPESFRVRLFVGTTTSKISLQAGLPFVYAYNQAYPSRPPSLIHSHGLWLAVNHWSTRISRKAGIPLLVQPHGMLSPWALRHRDLKKKLAMSLFQRADLEHADVLLATSEMEGEQFRKLGLRQPIAIVPNGITISAEDECLKRQHLNSSRIRTALFLSRIHPVKGLVHLVDAWSSIRPAGWRLLIAGAGEKAYLDHVLELIRSSGLSETIRYVGELSGSEKSAAYEGADLFVLPSYTENFGLVIAEALAHGLPVITTRGTPWSNLPRFNCGWWIEVGAKPLEAALRAAIDLSDEQRTEMGRRGIEFVRRYDKRVVAREVIDVYKWMLGSSTRPPNVI